MRNQVRKAFTLVEILIVVVILGILAAIVIPQFTSATQDAQAGNLKAQLQTLQSQIELFRARNNNTHPFATADWDALLGDGDRDGTFYEAGEEQYVKKAPTNPGFPGGDAAGANLIEVAAATGSATAGWVYDDSAGVNELYASYFVEATGKITSTATD
jgi:general secretion pathway protein G